MEADSSDSLVRAVARPWVASVGLVAALAQLIAAPWPLGIRLSIFGGLLLLGMCLWAYQLGIRRGMSLPAGVPSTVNSTPSPLASGWSKEDFFGVSFVKVAAGGNVMLCQLSEDGSILERLLARSGNEAHAFSETWAGSWFFSDGQLSIFVGGYHLVLQPSLKGTWTGVEYFGLEQQLFIGCVIDPEPVVNGGSWIGLKLGAGRSCRHLVIATENGRFSETDLYEKGGRKGEGSWEVRDGRLCFDVGGDTATTEPFLPGISIAMSRGSTEFALVRVRVSA